MRLKEIYEQYHEDIKFIFIYGPEPHPTEEWWLGESRLLAALHDAFDARTAIDIKQPTTLKARNNVAARAQKELFDGEITFYVDTIDDKVTTLYTSKPTRIYLLDADGRVVYNPGTGPFSFNPDHFAGFLEEYMARR